MQHIKRKTEFGKEESRKKALSPRKAAVERRKCNERVRLHRLKKKLSISQDADKNYVEFAYKSPQALVKQYTKFPLYFQTAQGNEKRLLQRLQSQVDFLCQVNTSNQMVIQALPSPQ